MKKFLIASVAIASSLLAYTYDEVNRVYEFDAGERFELSCEFKGKPLNFTLDDFEFTCKEVTYVKLDEFGGYIFSTDINAEKDDWVGFDEAIIDCVGSGSFELILDASSNNLNINIAVNRKNKGA
ncbi:MAG: hypothetical protein H7A40_02335 [Chlamydiales bacterium]|nr:hypothetical protein [Chlamydiales bacterium]